MSEGKIHAHPSAEWTPQTLLADRLEHAGELHGVLVFSLHKDGGYRIDCCRISNAKMALFGAECLRDATDIGAGDYEIYRPSDPEGGNEDPAS